VTTVVTIMPCVIGTVTRDASAYLVEVTGSGTIGDIHRDDRLGIGVGNTAPYIFRFVYQTYDRCRTGSRQIYPYAMISATLTIGDNVMVGGLQ
jgi:hypothetical protein